VTRREFITFLGGAALWPLAARAQPAKLPTIGFMGESTLAGQRQWVAAFVERLRELGWIEGRNVAVEYRWAEGRNERFAEIVAEFLRHKVDIVITQGTPAVLAAKQAMSTIPIVFAIAGNPVANGLVASLARPGGNVTGLSNQTADLAGKRLELLREVVPDLRRLIPPWCWMSARCEPPPPRLASKSPHRKSEAQAISAPRSRHSAARLRRSMSRATRS
jgi:putative tryptophan/tyrosine transport system substrate-binding protein